MSHGTSDPPGRTPQRTWQLVLEAAEQLGAATAPVPVSSIIAFVQSIDPTRGQGSIRPIIQGMTMGTRVAPRSPCGQVLRRAERGMYLLERRDAAAAVATTQTARPLHRRPVKPASRSTLRRSDARERRIAERVATLIADFDGLVAFYDEAVPFRRAGQYELHRQTIDRRLALGSVDAAIQDSTFTALLHRTLRAWGIGKRGSRLAPLAKFRQALAAAEAPIATLERHRLATARDLGGAVWQAISTLHIVNNVSLVVPGTKTLHHLLPNLVPPIDRQWTGRFFEWMPSDLQEGQEQTFLRAWPHLCTIASEAEPARLVGAGWRTSSSKLVDNAIVAYGMR